MPRFKPVDYSPKLIPVDFAQQVLPGSFEHALCYLVDRELDLSSLEGRFRNDAGGAPAFAPAILLKIVLLAYSRGIVSSRAMERACRDNVLFMAVSGDAQPHFTTLAAFVSDMGEEVAKLFTQVLLVCNRQGLIGREMFAIPQGDFLRGVDRRQAAVERFEGQERQPGRFPATGEEDREGRREDVERPPGQRCPPTP